MLYLERPTEEQLHNILKDIGTDEDSVKRDVKYLIDWLENTVYLPSAKDEEFFTSILIRCKNSIEKTKNFLDYYYTRRTVGLDMFAIRDPCDEELKRTFLNYPIVPLPKLTPDGYRIVCYSHFTSTKNVGLPKMSTLFSAWQIQLEVLIKSDTSKGIILISNSDGLSMSFSAALTSEFKKVLDIMKKTSKTRFKESFILNVTPGFTFFFNTTKQYLSGKLLGRVQIWTNKLENLAEVLPKEVLPSDFGGNERPLSELRDSWYEYVAEHRGWFKSEENMKADLSKRPKGDPISEEFSSFGLNGSFRKINLD